MSFREHSQDFGPIINYLLTSFVRSVLAKYRTCLFLHEIILLNIRSAQTRFLVNLSHLYWFVNGNSLFPTVAEQVYVHLGYVLAHNLPCKAIVDITFSNSLIIHEENAKENPKRIVSWYRGKKHFLVLYILHQTNHSELKDTVLNFVKKRLETLYTSLLLDIFHCIFSFHLFILNLWKILGFLFLECHG